jgi:hypothetical protein
MRDTAIPNDIGRRPVPRANSLTRIFICLLGTGAIAWGVFTLPLFWQEASPRSTAAKALQGESFKLQSLVEQAQQAERATHYRFCNPVALHSLFVLRLSVMNHAIEVANQPMVDVSYDPLHDAARGALACTPADSFIWLTLFWLDVGKRGLDDNNANYLRLSYGFGRNEGWIARWRIRLGLLLFERLPPDLSSDVMDDFINLMDTGQYYWQTAGMFMDASPLIQDRIVERLKTASLATRQAFARTLHNRGMDVTIPGVERPEARPWR